MTSLQRVGFASAVGVAMCLLGWGGMRQAGLSGSQTLAAMVGAVAVGGGTAAVLYRKKAITSRGPRRGLAPGGFAVGYGAMLAAFARDSSLVAALLSGATSAIGIFLMVAGPIEAFRIMRSASLGGPRTPPGSTPTDS